MTNVIVSMLCLLFTLLYTAHGFVVSSKFGVVPSTTKLSAAASEAAIARALEMSKLHGPTSKEAQLAWEEVEEVDASDNTVAFKGSLEEECSIKTPEEELACKEYNEKMDQLSAILKQEREPLRQIEDLVKQLKGIKLPKAPLSSGIPKPDTKAAIAEAKAAVAKFGASSVEAKLAWETVEEIAASDNSSVGSASLDEECLLELEEACATLHEFNDIIETAARF
mmetsp:Transcript_3175/g.4743  ORF Transcript_3175/g.4743 Transcript_3175/m.4743 type:complete len:224 (+) Transcript_3175:83-754(+)|eukprot:CAMPEP_0172419216 /NCGR_PEP_ID=MMETSP1064-20121228/5647_1 /TAXON_ID=202472 /ORGANISM="Aulacoseira subarctica , Strain CCAP 1002/5" /LENGTH=223 /DNA_ID=CAMNT_0013158573 /DNA_START=37 /DNA_END=708 /DNA_ORIENTATION=-